MRRLTQHRTPSVRSGLSLVEVVVIIIALLLLLSVILPAVNGPGRGNSRRAQCLSNLKNLCLAVHNYSSTYAGRLPPLSAPGPALASDVNVLWTINLLPYLDRADCNEYISQQANSDEAHVAMAQVLNGSFAIFQCPVDTIHFKRLGGLSYGANIGFGAWVGTPKEIITEYDFGATDHTAASIDWNYNGKQDALDKDVARATGLFWQPGKDGYSVRLDEINELDGATHTLLFAETITLPFMHQAGPAANGFNPSAVDGGIGLSRSALGLSKQTKPSLFLSRSTKPSKQYADYFAPAANCSKDRVRSPGASSMHSGVVDVVFAGGSAKSISIQIDPAVWAALHTPNGGDFGEGPVTDKDF